MTTAKKSVTRATVIAKAIEMEVWTDEEREVLVKMLASLEKPRKKTDAPTKTQIENVNLANVLVEKMQEHGEPVTAKWIADHIIGIPTAQKAVAVVKASNGRVVKFYEGRQAFYKIA